jgi:hypothetical protein
MIKRGDLGQFDFISDKLGKKSAAAAAAEQQSDYNS